MTKLKKINIDTKDIDSLIKSLKNLGDSINKLPMVVTEEIANEGLIHLNNLYDTRTHDDNIVDISTNVKRATTGHQILSRGRDVIYEEFGTGDKGEQSPHPDKSKYPLNDYNSGSFILDVSDVGNSGMLEILAKNNITSGKFWSYRKNGKSHLTQGVPAGMEMFKTGNHIKNNVVKKVLDEKVGDVLSKV